MYSVQRFSYIRYTGLDKFGFCLITVDIVESWKKEESLPVDLIIVTEEGRW